jgi:hypothetical protein
MPNSNLIKTLKGTARLRDSVSKYDIIYKRNNKDVTHRDVRSGFAPVSVYVRSVVDKVGTGTGFCPSHRLSLENISLSWLSTLIFCTN